MKLNRFFTGSADPASRRQAAAAGLVIIGICITLASLYFVFRVSAAGPDSIPLPPPSTTVPIASVPQETLPPIGEYTELREALAAVEAERDALQAQLTAAKAGSDQLRQELDTLRKEQATTYVLRFRVERCVRFADVSEVICFTLTVDEETYSLWEPGDVITDHASFLALPDDGLLHNWTVSLEEKFTANTSLSETK